MPTIAEARTLPAAELAAFLAGIDWGDPFDRGRVQGLVSGRPQLDPLRRAVEGRLAAVAPRERQVVEIPRLRGGRVRATEDRRPLTPGEVAWLGRLLVEPGDVSEADAAQLARLEAVAADGADRSLVESYLLPVRRHWQIERRRAELTRDAAESAPPEIATTPAIVRQGVEQSPITDILAELVHAEVLDDAGAPALTEREARTRAVDLFTEARLAAQEERAARHEAATAALAELDEGS